MTHLVWEEEDKRSEVTADLRIYFVNTAGDLITGRRKQSMYTNSMVEDETIATGFRNSECIDIKDALYLGKGRTSTAPVKGIKFKN